MFSSFYQVSLQISEFYKNFSHYDSQASFSLVGLNFFFYYTHKKKPTQRKNSLLVSLACPSHNIWAVSDCVMLDACLKTTHAKTGHGKM